MAAELVEHHFRVIFVLAKPLATLRLSKGYDFYRNQLGWQL